MSGSLNHNAIASNRLHCAASCAFLVLVVKMAASCKHHILCDLIAVLLINGMYVECYVTESDFLWYLACRGDIDV